MPDTNKIKEFLESRFERAGRTAAAHYILAGRLLKYHRTFGAVVVVVSSAVGTVIFTTWSESTETWIQLLTGLFSMISAVLAGLQMFFAYEKRSEQHRIAGVRFSSFMREAEEKLLFVETIDEQSLEDFGKRWDAMSEDVPIIPEWVWDLPSIKSRDFKHGNDQ